MILFRKLAIIIIALGSASVAQAGLIDRGSGLIYDDVLDITWLQNANLANQTFNWQGAVDWADTLNFGGFSDWRLPSMSVSSGLPTGTAPENIVDCTVVGTTEVTCRDNELGYMYWENLGSTGASGTGMDLTGNQTIGGVTLNNIQSFYWSGTDHAPDPSAVYEFQFVNGGQSTVNKTDLFSAWAVRDGDVLSVPEPTTLSLLGAGLIGMGWIRRRKLEAKGR